MAACMEALLRELFSPGCVCWGWLANPRPSAHPAEPYWYCHLAAPYVLWNLPQGWGLPVEMEGLQGGKAPWGEGEEGPQQFFMTPGFCSVPWIIKNRPPPRLHLQSEMYCVWILELAPEGRGGSMVLWDISASCRSSKGFVWRWGLRRQRSKRWPHRSFPSVTPVMIGTDLRLWPDSEHKHLKTKPTCVQLWLDKIRFLPVCSSALGEGQHLFRRPHDWLEVCLPEK